MLRISSLIALMLLCTPLFAQSLNCGWIKIADIHAITNFTLDSVHSNKVFVMLQGGGSSNPTCINTGGNQYNVKMKYGYIDATQPGYDSMLSTLVRAQTLINSNGEAWLSLAIDTNSVMIDVLDNDQYDGNHRHTYHIIGLSLSPVVPN